MPSVWIPYFVQDPNEEIDSVRGSLNEIGHRTFERQGGVKNIDWELKKSKSDERNNKRGDSSTGYTPDYDLFVRVKKNRKQAINQSSGILQMELLELLYSWE
eukprot:1097755_1